MHDIHEVLLNPVRMRIVQEVAAKDKLTTAELCERLPDVPKTTMYRHISLLLESAVLVVVSERKTRGSVERTFALDLGKLREGNTLENASRNAFAFLMNRYAGFERYFSGPHPDPGKDRIFLNDTILMLDDGEFDRFLGELRDLLVRYSFEASGKRKARDLSILSSPVGEE
jgi:DNA-binding transcriptional ArsR family regulator